MRALVLEHAEHEGAGLLGDALSDGDFTILRRRAWRGEALPAGDFDAVIAMGGPMSAWDDAAHPWLAEEAALLASSVRAGIATLGVCLGAQLMARGLGARVYAGSGPEMGLGPIALTDEGRRDPLLAPFDRKGVLHWHGDTFELPAGAVWLASTERFAHQAFRVGARAYALQFHVECGAEMRREWARLGERELRAAGVAPESLAGSAELDERGRAFAEGFVALASRARLR
jgi:GMP synthase (glutamine-hydrolysing)